MKGLIIFLMQKFNTYNLQANYSKLLKLFSSGFCKGRPILKKRR